MIPIIAGTVVTFVLTLTLMIGGILYAELNAPYSDKVCDDAAAIESGIITCKTQCGKYPTLWIWDPQWRCWETVIERTEES